MTPETSPPFSSMPVDPRLPGSYFSLTRSLEFMATPCPCTLPGVHTDNLPRNKSQSQAGKDVPVGQVGREGEGQSTVHWGGCSLRGSLCSESRTSAPSGLAWLSGSPERCCLHTLGPGRPCLRQGFSKFSLLSRMRLTTCLSLKSTTHQLRIYKTV